VTVPETIVLFVGEVMINHRRIGVRQISQAQQTEVPDAGGKGVQKCAVRPSYRKMELPLLTYRFPSGPNASPLTEPNPPLPGVHEVVNEPAGAAVNRITALELAE